jgi:hypothetical protein
MYIYIERDRWIYRHIHMYTTRIEGADRENEGESDDCEAEVEAPLHLAHQEQHCQPARERRVIVSVRGSSWQKVLHTASWERERLCV